MTGPAGDGTAPGTTPGADNGARNGDEERGADEPVREEPARDEPRETRRESLAETVHGVEAEIEAAEHAERPPPAGPLGNAVVALVVVGLGVAAVVGSLALGVGTANRPGPGTWPLLVGVVLTVLGVALLAGVRRDSDAERFSRSGWLVLGGLATMVVFVAVIEVVGFEVPTALLCFVWLRVLGREGWLTSILTSLGVVVAFYLVFVAALAVPIPHLF